LSAGLIPNLSRSDSHIKLKLALDNCQPDVAQLLYTLLKQHDAKHGHLNFYYVIAPLSSLQNLPEMTVSGKVLGHDGHFEWRWAKDSVTGIRTICNEDVAKVAPWTQQRSDAHIVTLLSPSTPVIVYCPLVPRL